MANDDSHRTGIFIFYETISKEQEQLGRKQAIHRNQPILPQQKKIMGWCGDTIPESYRAFPHLCAGLPPRLQSFQNCPDNKFSPEM